MHRPPVSSRSALVTAAVTLLLALHWWLAVTGWFGKSVTSDETAHLVAGYSYWKFNDYRLQPENGNLPQRWAALPLLVLQPRLDPAEQPVPWSTSHVWLIGQKFFFGSGNDTDFMLALARATMALWSTALGGLVFAWSRRLWGEGGGLFSLALYALSPTLLAHGPLVTSDTVAAFWLLAAVGAFWRQLVLPSWPRIVCSALVTAAAVVAKFSFLVLLPTYGLLAVAAGWTRLAPLGPAWWRRGGASVAVHLLAAWALVWACFGFRQSGFAPGLPSGWKYFIPWPEVLPASSAFRGLLEVLHDTRLLPEAYVHGLAYVLQASESRGAFLAGSYSQTGWWWFFPYAFGVKSTLAELAAAGLSAIAGGRALLGEPGVPWRERIRRRGALVPLVGFLAVYWGVSLSSNLNIGHRHLLPVYGPLFILSGWIVTAGTRGLRMAGAALALVAAVESARIRPHYLAYFNAIAGGPDDGWRHLVDSSLDWGQDLPALSAWLRANPAAGEKVYLSYFGMGDPGYEGIDAEPLAPYFHHYRPRHWTEFQPGLYCLGVTMLQNPYSEWSGPWLARQETIYRTLLLNMRAEIAEGRRGTAIAEFGDGPSKPLWNLDRLRFARLCLYLRRREPEATVNHTIHIYRLSAAELGVIVDGTAAELADLMENPARPAGG